MRLIFIGPPGSGKGTQAKLLSQRLELAHVSTGDILREAIRQGTPEGSQAQPFVQAGQLVPDEIVNEIVASRFRGADSPDQFVMDGYPRTLFQADTFTQVLKDKDLALDGVIFLEVPDQEIIRRLSGRWNCPNPKCKATYHKVSHPPKKAEVCDDCGTRLIQREDDREETVRKRLKIFHDLYDGLLDYYKRRNLLIPVPGLGDIETIYAAIEKGLRGRRASFNHAEHSGSGG